MTATPAPALLQDMPYTGGKSQAGVWQRIVNLIPQHHCYVEPFLGSGSVMRLKAPCHHSFGFDLKLHRPTVDFFRGRPDVILRETCGIAALEQLCREGNYHPSTVVAYCDPPYVLSARRGRRYYAHEMTDADHLRLLSVLRAAPFKWILSGYSSPLYNSQGFEVVPEWCAPGIRVESFEVTTRGHTKATEFLWFNFDRPRVPHDCAHVGTDHRDRWRIQKRRRRIRARFSAMQPAERATLFLALVDVMRAAGDAIPGVEIATPETESRTRVRSRATPEPALCDRISLHERLSNAPDPDELPRGLD